MTIAAIVGFIFALLRRNPALFVPAVVLALWFALGGHYVELAFLNVVRSRLPPRRLVQTIVRLLVWSGGGALLFACMTATAKVLAIGFPPRPWWFGSVVFVGIELVVHAALAARGRASFFDGRG